MAEGAVGEDDGKVVDVRQEITVQWRSEGEGEGRRAVVQAGEVEGESVR